MKRYLNNIAILFCVIAIAACSGGNKSEDANASSSSNGKKFHPKERTSSLTSEEKENAIQAKKEEMAEVNVETLLSPHSTRMTILPPAIQGDVTEGVCEKMTMKLLQIASQNGISGVNGSSPIAFAASLQPTDRSATGTAPQKMIVKYDATYYVLNTQTGDVYGSVSEEISGVGASFEDATMKATNELENSPEIQSMITQADERIISWFNKNPQTIINKVNEAIGNKDFALALAITKSVPESAKACYSKVEKLQASVLTSMKKQVAAEELAALKDAIAAAGTEYNPECAAHLAMLPIGVPEYKEGHAIYDKYIAHLNAAQMAQIKAEEKAREEQFELEKIQAKYEAEAAEREAKANGSSGGFFSNLCNSAKTFMSGMGAASLVTSALSRCLFIL